MASSSSSSSEIFLSVHVASLGPIAKQVKAAIESNFGKSCFLCTDLPGGVGFRDEIIRAAKQCRVFVAFMNQEWASSGECESEFLLAKRLNLTSHERGVTKPPQQPRRPIFLPVAFPNLAPWSNHAHVELLAASTNFVMAPKDGELDDRMIAMIARMASDFCQDSIDPSAVVASGGNAALMSFSTLRASLDALDVYINQASTVLANANALSNKTSQQKISPGNQFPMPKPTYIGFTFGRMNEFVESVFSLELCLQPANPEDVKQHGNKIPMRGVVTYKICSITTHPGYETKSNATFIDHLTKTQGEASAELSIAGTYLIDHGLLQLDDVDVLHDSTEFTRQPGWTRDSYRLLVSPDAKQITGTLRGWSNAWDIASGLMHFDEEPYLIVTMRRC